MGAYTESDWNILQNLYDHPENFTLDFAKRFLRTHKPKKNEDDILLYIYSRAVDYWWNGKSPKYLMIYGGYRS